MRGGFLHNKVLIEPIAAFFLAVAGTVYREYATGPGRDAGFVDLFVEYGLERIVCEAELSADRVPKDLAKAAALNATLLLIVVPNARVARSVRARASTVAVDPAGANIEKWILPLGVALQRLRSSCRFRTDRNVLETLRHERFDAATAFPRGRSATERRDR